MGKNKKLLKTLVKLIESVLTKSSKHHKHKHHHHKHKNKNDENIQQEPPPPPPPPAATPNVAPKRRLPPISFKSTKRRFTDSNNIPILSHHFYGGLMPHFNDRIRDAREVQKSSQGVTRKWVFNYSDKNYNTPQQCYNDFIHNSDIKNILHNLANEMNMIKFFFIVRSVYIPDESTDAEDEVPIFSRSRLCEITKFSNTDEIETILENIFNQISEDDSNHPQSGLSFQRMSTIELYVSKFRIIRGSSFIALPAKYQGLRCFINVINEDNQCFKYSVLAAIHGSKLQCNKDISEKYKNYEKKYKWDMLTFPVDATDYKSINEFELQNHLNINIYYIDVDKDNKEVFIPLRISKQSKYLKNEVVNLLLLKNETGSHYVTITSLPALFRKMIDKKSNTNNIFVCPYCLFYTYDENAFLTHNKHDCQDSENILRLFPDKDDPEKSYVKFRHWTHLQMLPVTLYYDTETYFVPYERELDLKKYKNMEEDENDINNIEMTKTEKSIMARHKLYSYCIYIDSRIPDIESYTVIKYKTDESHNIEKEFIDDIIHIYNKIISIYNYRLSNPKEYNKNPVTDDIHSKKTVCDYCGKAFNSFDHAKVLHHDHFTGEYIASIGASENLNIDIKKLKIPIIGHNAMKYDQHFIVRELAKYSSLSGSPLNIIPNTDENYKCIQYKNLIFIDSYLFLSGSLANLTSDLKITAELNNNKKEKFKTIYNNFKSYNGKQIDDDIIEKYLLQKNYFPYEHMTSLESFEEKFSDLSMLDFKSTLNDNASIKPEEYDFAMQVNSLFNFQTIREYNLFYLKIDYKQFLMISEKIFFKPLISTHAGIFLYLVYRLIYSYMCLMFNYNYFVSLVIMILY